MKHEIILHFRVWVIFDFMWIFVNLYVALISIHKHTLLIIFFRLSSIVLTTLRLLFAIGSSIIYATRMDTPLVRGEYDYMDYGINFYMF